MAIAARPEHMLFVGGEYYSDVVSSYASESESIGGVVNTGEIRGTFPDDSKYSSLGLFLQDEWSYCTCLKLTAGMRYSRITMKSPLGAPFGSFDESYDNMTGAFSVSYMPIESLNLIGRWSRGFRAPNLNDAVVLKYSSSGVDAPSLDLSPENSNNVEVGLKIRTEKTSESLMFFYNRLSNLIDRRPGTYDGLSFFDENGNGIQDPDEYDIYQKFNVGKAHIFGFEFDGAWSVGDRWQFRSNCFWTSGENETDDEPMSRIPPLMGMFAARYTVDDRLWAEAYVRAAGDQNRLSQRDIDDTRIGPNGTPGWVTLNLRGRKVFGDIAATLAVENLTDKLYKEHGSGVYSSGRNLVFTLSYGGR